MAEVRGWWCCFWCDLTLSFLGWLSFLRSCDLLFFCYLGNFYWARNLKICLLHWSRAKCFHFWRICTTTERERWALITTGEFHISSDARNMNFIGWQKHEFQISPPKTPTKLKVNWSRGSKFWGNTWGSFNQALIFLSCFSSFNKLPSTRLSVVD